MKRIAAFLSLLVAIACGPIRPPTPPTPPIPPVVQTLAADVVACKSVPVDNYCDGPADAKFTLDGFKSWTGDGNGYSYVQGIPTSLVDTFLTIDVPGYDHFDSGTLHPADLVATNDKGLHNFFVLKASHVDPSTIPLAELARIHGAMWTVRGPWRFGPRPGQPDNITALGFLYSYGSDPAHLSDEQQAMLATYTGLGYTHVVFGPINAASYHGQYPDTDFTSPEMFERWLDWAQVFWDHGLKPIVFFTGNGESLATTQAMWDHLIRGNARAQRLIRIVVPAGWEPTRYGFSSRTWGAFADWAHELLPQALILIHTVADVDAPVGTDALYDDNGKGNDAGWAYVAARIHGWLVQSGAFDDPTAHGDPSHPERTNFDNWAVQFSTTERGSYYDRFHNGYAGWPTGSLWGPNIPIMIYAGEYCSYWEYWQNRSYAECTAWGDRAMALGADGYLDSGTVVVPLKR
jgi:hypothetical protein